MGGLSLASREATVPIEAHGNHELEWDLTSVRRRAYCHVFVRHQGDHVFTVSAMSLQQYEPGIAERLRDAALGDARSRLATGQFEPRAHYRIRLAID